MRVSVKFDAKNTVKNLGVINKKIIPAATVSALNKTMNRAFTESKRDISKATGVKQKLIAGRLEKHKARRDNLNAEISMSLKPIPLVDIGKARQVKKGVRVGRKLHTGAFIATMSSGHTGVFMRHHDKYKRGVKRRVREGKNTGKTYRPQLPIVERKVNVGAKGRKILKSTVDRVAGREFGPLFEHELKRRMK